MMCEYCGEKPRDLEDEYGCYLMRVTKLTPLPAINLTTGETDDHADPPYYCLFGFDSDGEGEIMSFPIRFCPMCGRKLYD